MDWSADSYGDRAQDITKIAEHRNLGKRLARGYPMLEAEVIYAMESEMCETPEDFIARRTRLAFLDTRACEHALPRVRLEANRMAAQGPDTEVGSFELALHTARWWPGMVGTDGIADTLARLATSSAKCVFGR